MNTTVSARKISPVWKPDGTPAINDRVETGPSAKALEEWAARGLEAPNLERMRGYRLARLVKELQKRDLAGILLFDPVNIRYAMDASNMMLWTAHNPSRAGFVSASGHVILWEQHRTSHLASHLQLINEIRKGGAGFFYFETGDKTAEIARKFAAEIADVLREHGGANRRLAVDKIEFDGFEALRGRGIQAHSGQAIMEHAREIKGVDEIRAMRCALATCETAVEKMQQALVPGIAESELWAILHHENIARGGEWIETRILSSGPRTNPWMQECGPRVINAGDLVAFDTDMVSVYGICADISRTWLCGDNVKATDEQRRLYQIAHEHISRNFELLKPGVGFTELTEIGHRLPEEFRPQRYGLMIHGIGMCDEYPCIYYPEDFIEGAFDYVLQPGMTLCVEAYIGTVGGTEGVKLENQVLITESGAESLTRYPFEERLLAS
jgi:Xaa-Pro aminopeptidase